MALKKNSNEDISATDDQHEIPVVIEESTSSGDIKINLTVITKIVQLASREVPGVLSVGGGLVDELAGMFSKREAGVRVDEDDVGNYLIRLHVILEFGVDLAKTANDIQNAVRSQVNKMTSKTVSRVDVIIDDIKMPVTGEAEDLEGEEHPMD